MDGRTVPTPRSDPTTGTDEWGADAVPCVDQGLRALKVGDNRPTV
ncbi:hypothetical protein [Rhodococcus sp. (in: high G+C Gram-positive bacteria)]|nr:hypothetical protein [Rhodococcus sp. (in: high G+C Gram-positive bacteria)]